jgi:chromosome segregation ATPase
MPWRLTGHGCLFSEENHRQRAQVDETAMIHVLNTSMSYHCRCIWTPFKTESTEHIKYPKADPLAAEPERNQRLAQLTDELALKSVLLEQAEANAAEAAKRMGQEYADRLLAQVKQKDAELVNMQAKLDDLLQSRDQRVHALEQVLQKATTRAADADARSQRAYEQIGKYETELAEMRAKLEARESELNSVRLRLTDAENGWAKSKTEADALRAMTTAGSVSIDEDRITRRLMERMRAMEAEMVSLRLSEKGSELIQSRNEG